MTRWAQNGPSFTIYSLS